MGFTGKRIVELLELANFLYQKYKLEFRFNNDNNTVRIITGYNGCYDMSIVAQDEDEFIKDLSIASLGIVICEKRIHEEHISASSECVKNMLKGNHLEMVQTEGF